MPDPLDALDSCSRELVDFQARADKLQADTDVLIAGTAAALADSRRLMSKISGNGAMPRVSDEPLPASASAPPTPSRGTGQR
jgi:hypothetical protein